MTNDIFGHTAGDELIKKSSEILMQSCRDNDVIARVGGDEFIILLPKTTEKNAEKILAGIKSGFLDARVAAIKCSISLGLDTKRSPEQSLDEIMANAENAMYKDKTMNRKSINTDIIDTIIETLHSRSAREEQHSLAVSKLCCEVGAALNLSELEINKLKRAGYLHDIGKITLDESLLAKVALTGEELERMRQHSVVGYRILNLFDDTLDLAEYIYSHHERWDGTGYPRGLKGEQIPMISRIISIVETYDRVLNRSELSMEERRIADLEVIKVGAGTKFDPKIAELFTRMMEKLN
jgi:putative nucleotidyltransferase with HDIG domain